MASERQRIKALMSKQEATVRRAFGTFLIDTKSNATLREVRQLLEQGRLDNAIDIVDQHVVRFANVIPRVFANSADAEVEALGPKLKGRLAQARVAIGFDPTNERAADMMRTSRLDFIRDFTREQRNATRLALSEVIRTGGGPRDAAGRFKDSIGLTRAQLTTVDNYRRLLDTQNAQALDRVLRDRRFDASVERSLDGGEPLSGSIVDRMVERYQDRLLASRAETIARTETHRTLSQAREEATRQMLEQTGIEADAVRRVWNATQDGRTRDSHFAMDGQTRGLNEPFHTPSGIPIDYPGDPNAPAGEVINCRCVLSTVILADEELEAA